MKSCLPLLTLLFPALLLAKKNVCTVTINSKEERQVFQSKLNPQDFNFIELTDYATDKKNQSNDWFDKACEAQVQCDVLVISGHFGGSFFGDSNFSLGLNDLEKNSCHNRCPGILQKPQEVFLFGCNTLATKELDHRTPQQYYNALVEHNIDAVEAERIVAARYSPIGSSNGDRMRRIFEGVPMIYGFSSVGPAGKHIKPTLTKYLTDIGDYKKHLEDIEKGGRRTNPTFMKNMTAYTTHMATGAVKSEPAYAVKENSCKLSDYSTPVENRLDLAANILQESPYTYFPTVASFVNQNFQSQANEEPNDEYRKKLIRITARTELKDQVMKIAQIGGMGPALQMDLLLFSRKVLWLTGDEYKKQVYDLMYGLIKNPTLQSADSLCSLSTEYDLTDFKWTIRDLPSPYDFKNVQALKMLGCLEIHDTQTVRQILDSVKEMDLNQMPVMTRYSVYGLVSDLPGFDDEILNFFRSQPPLKGQYAQEMTDLLKGNILKRYGAEDQLEFYKNTLKSIKTKDYIPFIKSYFGQNQRLRLDSQAFLLAEDYKECRTAQYCYINMKLQPAIHDWIAKYLDLSQNPKFAEAFINSLADSRRSEQLPIKGAIVYEILKSIMINKNYNQLGLLSAVLTRAELSSEQMNLLKVLMVQAEASPSAYYASFVRAVLKFHQKNFPQITDVDVAGLKRTYSCVPVGRYNSRCDENIVMD